MICDICGHKLEGKSTRRPRKYHPACKRFRNFLDAAIRAVSEIDPKPTDAGIKQIQHEAFVAQCRISARVQKRDALGRFT